MEEYSWVLSHPTRQQWTYVLKRLLLRIGKRWQTVLFHDPPQACPLKTKQGPAPICLGSCSRYGESWPDGRSNEGSSSFYCKASTRPSSPKLLLLGSQNLGIPQAQRSLRQLLARSLCICLHSILPKASESMVSRVPSNCPSRSHNYSRNPQPCFSSRNPCSCL